MSNELLDRIEHNFTFHPPSSDDVAELHEAVRSECKKLAHFVVSHLPESRELSMALTSIEAAMHWTNAGVALHQDNLPGISAGTDPGVAESPDNVPAEDVTTASENTEQG